MNPLCPPGLSRRCLRAWNIVMVVAFTALSTASAQQAARASRALPPLKPEALVQSLALSEEQAAKVTAEVAAFNEAEKALTTQLAAAEAERAAIQAKMKAIFSPEQQKHLIVADLIGSYNDSQHMMAQLGITKLRPGKNGSRQEGPGFDLASANPWKHTLPELMKMKDGTPVTSAADVTKGIEEASKLGRTAVLLRVKSGDASRFVGVKIAKE